MRTVAEIQVTPQGTLWVDVHLDPPALAIRRVDAGLVRVRLAEIRHLVAALHDVVADLAGGVERYVEVANSDRTLFVDSTLWDPPGLAIWRTSGGLVRVTRAEIGDLMNTLALAGLELAALEAEAGEDEP